MRIYIQLTVFTVALCALVGCKDPGSDASALPPAGTYEYNGYDSTSAPLIQGWFTLNRDSGSTLTGEWHFTLVGNGENIGPQTGQGKLAGEFHDDTISIELQPLYRDNNVGLFGTLHGNEFTGRWFYSSYIGATNSGTFVAIRN